MVTLLFAMVMDSILVQYENAFSPIVVTLAGMNKVVSLKQHENASFPILCTEFGMVMEVTYLHT